jgi:hypothetical protein
MAGLARLWKLPDSSGFSYSSFHDMDSVLLTTSNTRGPSSESVVGDSAAALGDGPKKELRAVVDEGEGDGEEQTGQQIGLPLATKGLFTWPRPPGKILKSTNDIVRGRLHVSDSAYESPYDSVHDLHTKGLGFRLSFGHQLQLLLNTYQEKLSENKIANHLVHEIVHGIVCRFVQSYADSYNRMPIRMQNHRRK